MAMSTSRGGGAVADINITPLIDIMLVLLVIFMITAPVPEHDIKIDLPQPSNVKPPENPPTPHTLFIQADGSMTWDNVPISNIDLQAQLATIGAKALDQQPQVHIKATDDTQYNYLAQVMAEARRYNVQKIGFEK
ncbi:MAG: biopolymer transporter ExbD [Rhodanobacteraceae bacterium]|nr:MAG: biopolymer transporter ExbD [Rhodanobacteraceae bacterium]